MNVTLYKETYVSPRPAKLASVIESMKSEEKMKGIALFRDQLKYLIPGDSLPEDKKPPVVLFGASFKKEAGQVVMQSYNGVVLLEVNDLAGDAEIAMIRRKVAEAPQTLAAFAGSSGRSVKILVCFSLPGGGLPQSREQAECFHAHAYRKAVHYYRMLLERDLSLKQPVLERGCRFSSDPDLYYNPEALPVPMEQPLRMPSEATWQEQKMLEKDPLERLMPGMERSQRVSMLYEASLKDTLNHFGGYRSDDPKLFLVRLAENCFRSGIPEEDTVKWTLLHTELQAFEMLLRETVRNVYLLGKDFGGKPCLPPSQQLALQLEEFMQRRYEFRRNELKKEVEYRERRSYYFNFLPVTDEALNTISLQAHAEGLNFWDRDVKRYIYSNRIPLHNPVDHYLDHLPGWDGTDRIRALADTIPTQNADWRDLFYRWFLGMVAQWKQKSRTHANSVVPLLVGDQGCGKSTWCRNLIPHDLQEYYDDSLDFGSKRDAERALHRFILINLDEFDSISISYQPYLKHLLQKPIVNARRPYKSSIQALKRYGVFIATCNNMDLLTDPTGNRRYLCVEINGQIEFAPINYDQLYAQAMAALQNDERYWFDKEDEQLIMENNLAFEQKPVEEQLLLHYFRPAEPDDNGEWIPAIEIIQRISKRGKVKIGNTHIGHFSRILQKNRFVKKHANTGNRYHVVELG